MRKEIEKSIITKILNVYTVLPISLFGGVFWLVDYLDASDKTCHKLTPLLSGISASLLSILILLASYAYSMRKELINRPDFSGFIHDPENAYWINKGTNIRICGACKIAGELTPLDRFGDGWKCPFHRDVVGYRKSNGPIIRDDCINTMD